MFSLFLGSLLAAIPPPSLAALLSCCKLFLAAISLISLAAAGQALFGSYCTYWVRSSTAALFFLAAICD